MLLMLIALMLLWIGTAWSHNPFTSKPKTHHTAPEPPFKSRWFAKIIVWQHQLKLAMSEMIRSQQQDGRVTQLLLLLGLAISYGAIHAAGPGHGKAVAVSYVLSHKTTVLGSVAFGCVFAVVHGLSGVVGVVGLHTIIQKSVSETLVSVTTVTQIVSFGLITLLGIIIMGKHGFQLTNSSQKNRINLNEDRGLKKSILPWAAAVGLVPCPAVVMVMLFCVSMEVLILGLLLSAGIVFGMATTISIVAATVALGKSGMIKTIPHERTVMIEGVVGAVSGGVVSGFGLLMLISTINASYY